MRLRSWLWVLAVAWGLVCPEQGVWAEDRGAVPSQPAGMVSIKRPGSGWRAVFTRRTVLGLALTGGGVYFLKKGFDFHREADALYQRYLDALNPEEISLLYQRTTQRDLKSRLSWGFGAVLAAGGVHFLFGRHLIFLHLQPAPPLPGTWVRGAQVQLSRDF